jgi:vacuolar-type H+-ATPase subunit F/Vma7
VLSALAGHPALAVILVEEAVYDAMPPESRLPFDRSTRPVVVPFPSPAWGPPRVAEERVIELLRRAIGYRVRLK